MKTHFKYVIFGGAFDPIHQGHIGMINTALATINVETLYLMPTQQSPMKSSQVAAARHRFAMLELSRDYIQQTTSTIEVSSMEIDRPGVSYTIDTINSLPETDGRIGFLMGGDQFLSFHLWKDHHQLAAAMTLLVVKRNHVSADIYRQYQRQHGVNALFLPPTIQVSSTQIREMSMPKTGLDRIDAYIMTHGLYR